MISQLQLPDPSGSLRFAGGAQRAQRAQRFAQRFAQRGVAEPDDGDGGGGHEGDTWGASNPWRNDGSMTVGCMVE